MWVSWDVRDRDLPEMWSRKPIRHHFHQILGEKVPDLFFLGQKDEESLRISLYQARKLGLKRGGCIKVKLVVDE